MPKQRLGISLSLVLLLATSAGSVASLWVAAEARGYSTPIWASYKQWAQLGAQVRGGEKASLVVFYKEFTGDPNPDDEKRSSRSGSRSLRCGGWRVNQEVIFPTLPKGLGIRAENEGKTRARVWIGGPGRTARIVEFQQLTVPNPVKSSH